eukprot:UN34346
METFLSTTRVEWHEKTLKQRDQKISDLQSELKILKSENDGIDKQYFEKKQ